MSEVSTTVKYLDCGGYVVTYHNTEVVRVKKGILTLDSSGWKTATTKKRMNKHTPDSIQIYQEKGKWWVATPMGDFEFMDKMRICLNGGGVCYLGGKYQKRIN